jgi:hypothetical protein
MRRSLHTLALAGLATGCGGGDGGRSSGSLDGDTFDGVTSTGHSEGDTRGDAQTDAGETGTSDGVDDDSTTGASTSDETTGGEPPCRAGDVVCEDGVAKVCDGMGGFSSEDPCDEACAPGLGCVLCIPGEAMCDGNVSQVCTPDGDGWIENECDPVQGVECSAATGQCVGACAPASLGNSYIGCDYYPTVTQQLDVYNTAPANQFAVAVSNTSNVQTQVTITRGPNMIGQHTVAPGSVEVIILPWVDELTKGYGPTAIVSDGAYRLRADQPVTVYQYNPVEASVTNDSSLLLPVNVWTGAYVVAAWPHWSSYPGFYAVVAARDATSVTVTAPGGGTSIQAGAGVSGQGFGNVMLDAGDVLQVVTSAGGDPTGTLVSADGPVQVLGGHTCTQVPIGTTACDHLEEAMFPIETLSTDYIVAPPVQVPNTAALKAQVVRVIAAFDDTNLQFTPDMGVNTHLAVAGDFVEIPMTTTEFRLTSDNRVLVAQYMVGQSAGYGTSDPAMVLTVPLDQYRSNYLFFAATSWTANFVDIIAPTGAEVSVDGDPVGAFSPVGMTGYSVARVGLSNAGNGNHTVVANQDVGIGVYGVQSFGSYWYPGGLDLEIIPQ